MELVRFKAKCRKCRERLRITLDQARADQSIACSLGHTIRARAAIESKLINGVNRGSLYYFERLVDIFDRDIRRIVRRRLERWLGSDLARLEMEDAVQEVYADLWQKKLKTIDKNLTGYIRRMAFNKGIDRMRERADSSTEPLGDGECSAISERRSEDVVLKLERAELLTVVAQALSTLPRDQREVYRLRREEGRSELEVAKTLSIPAGTVKSRLNRAEKTIRQFVLAAVSVRSVQ
jgi:RNA polymerase sigma factor (sigma-70 family)